MHSHARQTLRPHLLALLLLLVTACGSVPPEIKHQQRLRWGPVEERQYALDQLSRKVPKRGRIGCPKVELVRYQGTSLPYHRHVRVNPWFATHLAAFEEVVRHVAVEVYGRAPARLRHYGAYNCRGIRGRRKRLSEHGLGNALDVSGFEFDAAPGADRWSRPFRIDIKRHWSATDGDAVTHAIFLRRLLRALRERPDIFRGMIGPPDPGHHDHFHFDVAPYRYMKAVAQGASPPALRAHPSPQDAERGDSPSCAGDHARVGGR